MSDLPGSAPLACGPAEVAPVPGASLVICHWFSCPPLARTRAVPRSPVIFKNYKPQDSSLKRESARASAPAPSSTLRAQIAVLEEADRSRPADRPLTLAPKKDTWDLKRDMRRKLRALDDMTETAIDKLRRQRAAERRAAAAEPVEGDRAAAGAVPAGSSSSASSSAAASSASATS